MELPLRAHARACAEIKLRGAPKISCPQHRRERHECHCMLFLPEEHGFAGDSDEIGLAEVEELTANFKPPPQ